MNFQLMHTFQHKDYVILIKCNNLSKIECQDYIFLNKIVLCTKKIWFKKKGGNTLSLGSNSILKISWFFG
jgi:hypothetical protein